jgi:cell wall-associated NlpC family hydrolase
MWSLRGPGGGAALVRPGDLVFVHNGGGSSVSHVAIYAGG